MRCGRVGEFLCVSDDVGMDLGISATASFSAHDDKLCARLRGVAGLPDCICIG